MEEWEREHREDFYHAQIAAEIRMLRTEKQATTKELMIKFKDKDKETYSDPESSKSFWLGSLGLQKED